MFDFVVEGYVQVKSFDTNDVRPPMITSSFSQLLQIHSTTKSEKEYNTLRQKLHLISQTRL